MDDAMGGFPKSVMVTDQEIDLSGMSVTQKDFVHKVADDMFLRYQRFAKPRAIFGVAGPSGAGKSVLAALAKELARGRKTTFRVETVSIDAFHFPNEYLAMHEKDGVNLQEVKGRHDTYDTQLLASELAHFREGAPVRFPAYSRTIHDPVPNAIAISEPDVLLILEGLWLLHGESGWQFVRDELDYTYFLDDELERLRKHTIMRHVRGGRSETDAARFYDKSDMENYRLVIRTKKYADQFLSWPSEEKRKM
ncbi:MAG: hypothetical protein Q7S52_03890 [bacterium]|nr:hypothetical protein [bacterium]